MLVLSTGVEGCVADLPDGISWPDDVWPIGRTVYHGRMMCPVVTVIVSLLLRLCEWLQAFCAFMEIADVLLFCSFIIFSLFSSTLVINSSCFITCPIDC